MSNCPECGHEVSSTAKTCPHCGFRLQKKRHFKKAAAIVLPIITVVLALLLIHCGVASHKIFLSTDSKLRFYLHDSIKTLREGGESLEKFCELFNQKYAQTENEDKAIQILKDEINGQGLFYDNYLADFYTYLGSHMNSDDKAVKDLLTVGEVLSQVTSIHELTDNPKKYKGQVVCVLNDLNYVDGTRQSIYLRDWRSYKFKLECFYNSRGISYGGFPWNENLNMEGRTVLAIGHIEMYSDIAKPYMRMLYSACDAEFETWWDMIEFISDNSNKFCR